MYFQHKIVYVSYHQQNDAISVHDSNDFLLIFLPEKQMFTFTYQKCVRKKMVSHSLLLSYYDHDSKLFHTKSTFHRVLSSTMVNWFHSILYTFRLMYPLLQLYFEQLEKGFQLLGLFALATFYTIEKE